MVVVVVFSKRDRERKKSFPKNIDIPLLIWGFIIYIYLYLIFKDLSLKLINYCILFYFSFYVILGFEMERPYLPHPPSFFFFFSLLLSIVER